MKNKMDINHNFKLNKQQPRLFHLNSHKLKMEKIKLRIQI